MTITRSAADRILRYASPALLCALFLILGVLRRENTPKISVGVAWTKEDLAAIPLDIEIMVVRFPSDNFHLLSEFINIRRLDISYSKSLSKESMGTIAKLPRIESLHMSHISDYSIEMFEVLKHSESLREIELTGIYDLNDQVLYHLAGINGLRILNLAQTMGCSDKGIAAISVLPLTDLTLSLCEWVDASIVKELNGIASLERLDLSGCRVFGNPKKINLRQLERLQELRVAHTLLNDLDCKWVSELPELSYLDITGTHVTGLGLIHLAQGKNLKILQIGGKMMVTDAEQHEFRLKRPDVIMGGGVGLSKTP